METTPHSAPSRTPRKWLRRIAWSALWLATILTLAISLLDAYVRHRYQTALTNATAAGLPNSWDDVLLKPVEDTDNFGALEDFKPFLAVEEVPTAPGPANPFGTKLNYLDEKGMEALKSLKPLKVSGGSLKSLGPFEARNLADLRQKAIEDNRLTLDSANLSDSDAILKVFENIETLWLRLHAAKLRTHAVLFIPLKPSLMLVNPMLTPSLTLAHIAQLKARAFIGTNRGAEALEECLLLLKIADLRTFPTLIEHLVRTTEIGILMPALYEGISQHVWSDAQLEAIEKKLARYDLLSDLKQELGGEALFSRTINERIQSSKNKFSVAAMLGNWGQPSTLMRAEGLLSFVIPKTVLNILCTANLETVVQMAGLLSEKDNPNLRGSARTHDLHWGPLNSIAGLGVPAIESVLKSTARGQSLINIARVAIALERHRLKHGTFPSTLKELAPAYLPAIPVEVFDGAPLHYTPKANREGFTLYSTGWKGTDDGGVMDNTKPNETNWTWATP